MGIYIDKIQRSAYLTCQMNVMFCLLKERDKTKRAASPPYSRLSI